MEKEKTRKKKRIYLLAGILLTTLILVMAVRIYAAVFKPKPVEEIKLDTTYIGGQTYKVEGHWVYENAYPSKVSQRVYVEFRKDKTYVILYDDTRDEDRYYGGEEPEAYKNIRIFFGTYEVRDGEYFLTVTDSGEVNFENGEEVKENIISYYKRGCFNGGKWVMERGRYLRRSEKEQYGLWAKGDEDVYPNVSPGYYILYDKSDIQKLPATMEEFRRQFYLNQWAVPGRMRHEVEEDRSWEIFEEKYGREEVGK